MKSIVGLNKVTKLELYNVPFIPGLESNLLSVRKANSMGKRVTFQDGMVTFESFGEVIAQGGTVDGLFCLDLIVENKVGSTAFVGNKQVSLLDWHRRLGHLGFTNIEKLLKHEMVEGIDLSSKDRTEQKIICESCLAGNQTSEKYQKMEIPRSSRPLELVHSDVCGYLEKATFDGHRDCVTFIDDYTHFTVIYLIKRKNEVFARFKEYEAMASAHFGQKLSKLRCDNGREYLSNEFQNFCKTFVFK